jgi:hypothetical protein
VEDERAAILLREILVKTDPNAMSRIQIVPYGAASVGRSLGQMAIHDRFPRPSVVFLDGDQSPCPGCVILPGKDAPEIVVFRALQAKQWTLLDSFILRPFANIVDACERAMTTVDHHEWVQSAAGKLMLGSEGLWEAMCAEWVANCLSAEDAKGVADPIRNALLPK